ncbi:MAG: ABC transporter permease [Deltaproteobacteria bacterium]|nr:ABC transporter permease [Deltaproteobacteria bacterium]
MSTIIVLIKKELKQFFISPIAYVVMMIYLTLSGFFFYTNMERFSFYYKRLKTMAQYSQGQGDLAMINLNEMVIAPALFNMVFVFLFIIPLIMMKSLAEEQRQKTDELLRTSPLTVNQMIAGKYLGSLLFIMGIILPTVIYQGLLFYFSSPELGPVITGYLGIILFIAAGVSVGLFASSLTENQIIAAVIAFVVLLFLFIINLLQVTEGNIFISVLTYLSVTEHLTNMLRGSLDTRDLVYFFSFILFFLFLTKQSMTAKGWR